MRVYNVLLLIVAPTVAVIAGMAIGLFAPGTLSFILFICGTGLVYGCGQYYALYGPTLRAKKSTRDKVARCLLEELKGKLEKLADSRVRSGGQRPSIRLNVMDVRGGLLRNRYLQMAVCTTGYREAEVELQWLVGQGACGLAWREKRQVAGGGDDFTSDTLSNTQREVCRDVKSVLSTPIKPRNRRIQGIMNVDSTVQTAAQLRLKKQDVQDIAQVYGDIIAELY